MSSRIVIVTGAGGGLGRAVTQAFRHAGDLVVPVSRSSAEFAADLSDAASTDAAFRAILDRHGHVDCLVHTVGGFESAGPVAGTGIDVWERMLRVNFHSAIHAFRSVLPHMIARGSGRIVAVGSRAGAQPSPGMAAYGVSKAALHALVQTVALEVSESGITVNAVLPGTIDTPANREWGAPDQVARWVPPDSIAAVVLWLTSAEAADVNGALLPVYGKS